MKTIFFRVYFVVYFLFMVIGFSTGNIYAQDLTITKVGEWGSGIYKDVFVQGNYAYCAAFEPGLVILDVSNPALPQQVGMCETPGDARSVVVNDGFAYIADGPKGLRVIDISSPTTPKPLGYFFTTKDANQVAVSGNYVYVTEENALYVINVSDPYHPIGIGYLETPERLYRGINSLSVKGNLLFLADGFYLYLIDISDPSSPSLLGQFSNDLGIEDVFVKGNYAFITMSWKGFKIVDISDPFNPHEVSFYHHNSVGTMENIHVIGNYAYVSVSLSYVTNTSSGQETILYVMDISEISNPTKIGSYWYCIGQAYPYGLFAKGDQVYISTTGGLLVFDVSTPSSPRLDGLYQTLNGKDIEVAGNYAYVAGDAGGITIFDVSSPTSPVRIAGFNPGGYVKNLYLNGKYLFAADETKGLVILDVSDPRTPSLVTVYDTFNGISDVFVRGGYAFLATITKGFSILDISDPSTPQAVGSLSAVSTREVFVQGNYAYLVYSDYDDFGWMTILNISDLGNPVTTSTFYISPPYDIYVSGNYAYVSNSGGLQILDVSNPASPSLVGSCNTPGSAGDIHLNGNTIYIANGSTGLQAVDISIPSNPYLAGSYDTSGYASAVFAGNDYVYLADGNSGKFYIFSVSTASTTTAQIAVDRSRLHFASSNSGNIVTPSQTIYIYNSGSGTLDWSASVDQTWLNCTPSAGSGSGEITVSVNAAGLLPGYYSGTIAISSPDALNSPQTVEIILNVIEEGQSTGPFGIFSTPLDNSTVSSSIPVTGWVLDDIGVQSVKLYREEGSSLVYIGDAVFVEGARPDVEQAYPGYPNNYQAGWGYMLLTNFLPDGGNGTFTIHATAADLEGNQVTLGTKTIICDNANAVKPFGAIDTPAQGGTAGSEYVNFGWALTPLPNTIPTDGSTIRVWVDGVPLGNPVYNQYREDIATLFPGYNNSSGAVGYFYLDTTKYKNGVHTIYWSIEDDAGNEDGIGSRYFTVRNNSVDSGQWTVDSRWSGDYSKIPVNNFSPVKIKKGYNLNAEMQEIYPGKNGISSIKIEELGRVALFLNNARDIDSSLFYSGYLLVGNRLKPLPIGSFLDSKKGVFYWQAGPGFIGEYRFIFIEKRPNGELKKRNITVVITPKFQMKKGLK